MKRIIVFGRGAYYKKKKGYLLNQYKIVAFLDNNIKDNVSEENVPVYLPEEMDNLPHLPIFIMVSNNKVIGIVKQLLNLNVDVERIRLGFDIHPLFNSFEKYIYDNGVDVLVRSNGIYLRYNEFETVVNCVDDFFKAKRCINKLIYPYIDSLAKLPITPVDRYWGNSFGSPIDRRYIEDFLQENSDCITGDVAEIADNYYTQQFGHELNNTYALHVNGDGNTIKCNLATGEGVIENFCDCLICTQTLQFIFDLQSTVKNIHKILKPNGTALITVPGISQLDMYSYERWGESWRFTKQSLRALFEDAFDKENITVDSYGNVKTAVCFLYGLCREDLSDDDYAVNDEMYPVILTLACHKVQ